jgi:hypothetical protein
MSKKEQNNQDNESRNYQDLLPGRIEILKEKVQHTFPDSIAIDDPREWGKIGARIVLEQVLMSNHGFSDNVLEGVGVSQRDIAKYRKEIVSVLRQIVADSDSGLYTNRSAAIMLLGELAKDDALSDLKEVLRSPFESVGTRGWAALTIGRKTGEEGSEFLRSYLDDPSPIVRRRVIKGLALNGTRNALPELVRIARKDPDDKTARYALEAVRSLEQQHGLDPADIEERKFQKSKKPAQTRTD